MKFALGWGESVSTRQAFKEVYGFSHAISLSITDILSMGYTPFEGDPLLIDTTRRFIENLYKRKYKHVLLTNGASGAIMSILTACRLQGFNTVITNPPPFFSLYPSLIQTAGLRHVYLGEEHYRDRNVYLIDSPTNPTGKLLSIPANMPDSLMVLDAVYNNNVYVPPKEVFALPHDVLVGSYSKLLGVNGTRIGWIALDDDILYERLKIVITAQYSGLSKLSMDFINTTLEAFNFSHFENVARNKLDANREEWAKLERYFGNNPVSHIGMFYYGPIDNSADKLLRLSNVEWVKGGKLAHSDDFGRFNIGQDPNLIKEVVKEILKNDGA